MKLWDREMPHRCQDDCFEPYLTPYIAAGSRTAVVVCPGGAYCGRAAYEGDDVAVWLNTIGLSAFVLEYRVAPSKAPAQPADVQRAIRLARKIGVEYGITQVGIMGFSAGGHLAALASVHYEHVFYPPVDDADALSARPDFTVLCYSVIDMGVYRHDWSRRFLLGEEPAPELVNFYSPHLQVTEHTPPAFLWHTAQDASVSAVNTMLYAQALQARGVSYEMHIFPFGEHGKALAMDDPHVGAWKDLLKKWLILMKFL
ncbi:MAG: alpha/beta hydrolase [Candidatus Avoscillospira sp.]